STVTKAAAAAHLETTTDGSAVWLRPGCPRHRVRETKVKTARRQAQVVRGVRVRRPLFRHLVQATKVEAAPRQGQGVSEVRVGRPNGRRWDESPAGRARGGRRMNSRVDRRGLCPRVCHMVMTQNIMTRSLPRFYGTGSPNARPSAGQCLDASSISLEPNQGISVARSLQVTWERGDDPVNEDVRVRVKIVDLIGMSEEGDEMVQPTGGHINSSTGLLVEQLVRTALP
ncbi:unnamed protein product, partial [Sphacelaria rigidula]